MIDRIMIFLQTILRGSIKRWCPRKTEKLDT